jgi:hypothetical protein
MTAYVAGFLFDRERVALIRKSRPQWQAGRLPNLSWLIPLARYRHDRYVPVRATEVSR